MKYILALDLIMTGFIIGSTVVGIIVGLVAFLLKTNTEIQIGKRKKK